VPLDHFEQLQVVRYEPGQFYKPHHDYLDANLADVKSRGQRAVTVFVYLNNLKEGEEGGGTKFPLLGKTLTPDMGTAAMWWSYTADGKLDEKTLHSGEPVHKSIKYGLNIWARDRPQTA
jgi:prolyl 4-hydroxylase